MKCYKISKSLLHCYLLLGLFRQFGTLGISREDQTQYSSKQFKFSVAITCRRSKPLAQILLLDQGRWNENKSTINHNSYLLSWLLRQVLTQKIWSRQQDAKIKQIIRSFRKAQWYRTGEKYLECLPLRKMDPKSPRSFGVVFSVF